MTSDRKLTKSKFKLALECPTKLYYVDKPQYANQKAEDSFLKALAESGYQVEALARCYFPDGIFVEASPKESILTATNRLLQNDSITLFEAEIAYKGYLIRTDILIKHQNHLKLIEIKAKSIDQEEIEKIKKIENKDGNINAKWKPYIADIAFQKWVLKHAYPNYRISSYLMLVNKDSICPTDGLNQKFLLTKNKIGKPRVKILEPLTSEDLSTRLLKEINVDQLTEKMWSEVDTQGHLFSDKFYEFSQQYFNGIKSPPIPKKECAGCQFKTTTNDEGNGLLSGFKECWHQALGYNDKDFLEPTVLDLWGVRKDPYLRKGLIKLRDFTENDIKIKDDNLPGMSSSRRQWLQIEKAKNNDDMLWIDKQGLSDEIQSWTFPLHFIDFETAMLPIPFKKGAHPYQGIAFQFSHHILDENGCVKHAGEYLNTDPGVDPSIEFVRALKTALENDSGTIFRYSNHENSYLNMILSQMLDLPQPPPDLEKLISFIKSITKLPSDDWLGDRCMVDLCELVKRFYYDPLTNGSNSIKKVLPAILNRSKYLQQKYSQPIYGCKQGIKSKNFSQKCWIVFEDGDIKDPYSLLEPINKDVPNEEIGLLFDDEYLKEGGAATIAYAKLQFTQMSDFEREDIREALLKYCELDTLAMVMIVEAWQDMLR
ncbi:DUF2779 domain-containing protein [Legionella pneumophila serogroup 1]|uniref:DUF2779 domain-containing protein n=1 Tax=Legionella pneumophila TaxID=446 RepID=UPI0007709D4B|nr:DUF2779 domain-containing protein [Legionella pneumophila]HAT8944660.1 DUF2779 domain-containing protein [Legionella pneumophila subsp. pneumophila]MCH9059813.1 DUF2779 domain-containing protein [Legionella pneumophila serogroup 1]MCH9062493.1 DUF2779 domain-containing protein [Legionella pneumophila serogroup 1]MCH9065395.1 DUF2779 domain-containing protein [Legionella pneumophila serogroup 1]MCH9068566.1 DUF2779 domain-containing protein [Legionella pneumophila serogroup 1]